VRRKLDETEIPVETEGIPPDLLQRLAADDDAETYQFVFVARPAFERRAIAPGASLSERLLAENELLRSRFAEVEAYARSLEGAALKAADAAPSADSSALAIELERRLAQARQTGLALHADLAAKDAIIAEVRQEFERVTEETRQAQLVLGVHRPDVAVQDASKTELRAELERRMKEAHQMHLALRHAKADIAVKEAFIAALRQDVSAADLARATAESSLQELRVYANSAGFRMAEKLIGTLRHAPFVFERARALVRRMARRPTLQ
jgi:hypothetical protein